MSQGRDNPPTDRLRRRPETGPRDAPQAAAGDSRQATHEFATQRLAAGQNASPTAPHHIPDQTSAKRWDNGRDVVAGVLLLIAPLFPWNLYFGIGIPHSSGAVFALLAVATALSLVAIAITHTIGSRPGNTTAGRVRLALNIPYALLVAGFVGFDVVQTVRYGGSGNVPGGVGPGAWLGISGASVGCTAEEHRDGRRRRVSKVAAVGSNCGLHIHSPCGAECFVQPVLADKSCPAGLNGLIWLR